jgi:glutamine amidotransferase
MCRLLGIVARETREFRHCLRDAPGSLEALGREHSDGWGIAVHDTSRGWSISKRATSASSDPAYVAAVAEANGSLLLAHVRKRTVGAVSLDNTHPFRDGDWVFAHNGTIDRVADLRTTLDDAHLATIRGETDSEVLFAFLMAKLASHPSVKSSRFVADMVLARAVEDLAGVPSLGAATFLLSDGVVLYAYCQGRPLALLERRRDSRSEAILIASEHVTSDEPWTSIAEGTLLTVWRRPYLGWAAVRRQSSQSNPRRGSVVI